MDEMKHNPQCSNINFIIIETRDNVFDISMNIIKKNKLGGFASEIRAKKELNIEEATKTLLEEFYDFCKKGE